MKAMIYERYGGPEVLHPKEVETPVPGDDEILIRIHAATVTSGDCRLRSMNVPPGFRLMSRAMFGLTKPRRQILGTELAGVVESAGANVRRFRAGDRVFAFPDSTMGAYAEYKAMPEDGPVAHIPGDIPFVTAAALSFGGTTALHFLRKAKLREGETVLVNGASGGVGSAAIQIARHMGAEVTAVCSAANAELVRSLGAEHVIDYRKEDFTAGARRYDVIVDTAGTAPFARSKHALAENGRLCLVLAGMPQLLAAPLQSMSGGRKVIAGVATGTAEDLAYLAGLAEAGSFTPFIDRHFSFDGIPDAHRHVETGRKRGNVVITMQPDV